MFPRVLLSKSKLFIRVTIVSFRLHSWRICIALAPLVSYLCHSSLINRSLKVHQKNSLCGRGLNFWPMKTAIVQRVKVSAAILTDLSLLLYQTAVIQWRILIKIYVQIITEYSYWKSKTTMIYKAFILMKKFLYKFRIIILSENANLKSPNMGWQKYTKAKYKND